MLASSFDGRMHVESMVIQSHYSRETVDSCLGFTSVGLYHAYCIALHCMYRNKWLRILRSLLQALLDGSSEQRLPHSGECTSSPTGEASSNLPEWEKNWMENFPDSYNEGRSLDPNNARVSLCCFHDCLECTSISSFVRS